MAITGSTAFRPANTASWCCTRLLDTVGVLMRTPAYPFAAGEPVHELDLTVPGGDLLAKALCRPAQLTRGPGLMVGFVRDPDTNAPAVGAKVELVFQVTDLIGRKSSTVRSDLTDSTGMYHICGIPADMSGKVQVFRNGVSSGEVPVDAINGVALRAFSIVGQHQAVAEMKNDSGKVKRVAIGSARDHRQGGRQAGAPAGRRAGRACKVAARWRSAAPTATSRSTACPRAPRRSTSGSWATRPPKWPSSCPPPRRSARR